MFVAIGAVTMGLLQAHFALHWRSYYSHYPASGSAGAMASGRIPPFFASSNQSLLVTMIALFVLSLVALWFARGRYWLSAVAMWAGVMLSVSLIWIGTKQLREDSNMWPIDFVVLSIATALPVILGTAISLGIQKAVRRGP